METDVLTTVSINFDTLIDGYTIRISLFPVWKKNMMKISTVPIFRT